MPSLDFALPALAALFIMGGCQSQNMPVEETTIVAAVNTLDAEVEAGMPKVEGVMLDQVSGYQAAPVENVAAGAPLTVAESGMVGHGILTANAMEIVDADPALLQAAAQETGFKGYNSPEEAMAAYEAQMAANAAQLPAEVQAFNKEQYENAGRHPFHYQENQPQAMYINQPHASGYVVDQPIIDNHQIAQSAIAHSVHDQSVAGDHIQHNEHPQNMHGYSHQLAAQQPPIEYGQQHSEAFQNQAYARPHEIESQAYAAENHYATTQPQPIENQAQPMAQPLEQQPIVQLIHQGVQQPPAGYDQPAIGYGQYRQPINEQPKLDEQPQPSGYEQPAYERPAYEQPATLEEPSQAQPTTDVEPAVIEEDGKIIQQFENAEAAVDDVIDEVELDHENDDTLVAEKDQKKKSSKGKKKKKTSSKKKRWGWM